MSDRKFKRNREKNKKMNAKVSVILTLFGACVVVFPFLIGTHRYRFVDGGLFPHWYVALGIGILAGVAFALKFFKKEHGIGTKIGAFLGITFVVFMVTGFALGHINHVFDTSEAVRYYVEIEDKDIDLNRRALDTYDFKVTVGGDTFRIDVPSSHYYALDVGDSYIIEYHEGALGAPYYIAVGPAP